MNTPTLTLSENLWLIYFCIYNIFSTTILLMLNNLSFQHSSQIPLSWNLPISKFMISVNLLSLGGLPPFLGFLPKLIIIQSSYYSHMEILVLLMILCTLITLFYDIRMVVTSFLIYNPQLKWTQSFKTYNFYFISLLTSISHFTLPLYPILN